jgi:hypothetical protein
LQGLGDIASQFDIGAIAIVEVRWQHIDGPFRALHIFEAELKMISSE